MTLDPKRTRGSTTLTLEGLRKVREAAQRQASRRGGIRGIGVPGGFRRLHPTWPMFRVPMSDGERAIDAAEAATRFAGKWWASRAHYCGAARGLHVFERPPDGERPAVLP